MLFSLFSFSLRRLDTIDNQVTEKLNVLTSIIDAFIFENMSELHHLNLAKKKAILDIVKKTAKGISAKLKEAVEVNNVNKYHISLRYGNGELKTELLNNLEKEEMIPSKLKQMLKQASHNSPNYINAAEASKFISTLYGVYFTKIQKMLKFAKRKMKECMAIMKL